MKVIQFLLIFLLCFLGVIIMLIFFSDPPPNVTGKLHDTYPSMLHSGTSHVTSAESNILAYLFGFFVIGTLCFFVVIGGFRNEKLGSIKYLFGFGSTLYLTVFSCLYFSDRHYSLTGHGEFFLGWPLPTAWMMYAMWFTPLLFVLGYTFKFRDWVLSEEDEAKFKQIVERRNRINSPTQQDGGV